MYLTRGTSIVMREHMICTCGLLGPVVGQYNIIDSCLDSPKLRVSEKGLGKAQGRLRSGAGIFTAAH